MDNGNRIVETAPSELTTVKLGGKLGQEFGEEWQLKVGSPGEALRAIDANTRGKLREYLGRDFRHQYYQISLGDPDLSIGEDELVHRSGRTTIYISPVIGGRNSGTAKIIAGVALLAAVAIVTYGFGSSLFYAAGTAATATTAGTAGGLTFLGSIAVGLGTSLILGGISQLLAPHPNDKNGGLNSNIFQGSIAPGNQGGCVPVVYGRALVSPLPISILFKNVDYNTTQNTYVGTLEAVGLAGGGTEYVSNSAGAISGPTNSSPDPGV